ncbi:hypothetical protein N8368_00740 [Bacteroidia bacterium]|nr:hypothetical protein [Bacteroidia bacterium]MDC1395015.1 hypothetical protein [Bacteroidia bacterium]
MVNKYQYSKWMKILMVIATVVFLGGAIAALVVGENFTASIFGGQ